MRYRETIKFAALLLVALGAGPAYSAFWQWSKTATNNSTADPSINWSEGMSPSSVNDSARAMMARLAEQGADVAGVIFTGGTSTAYTATTSQGIQTPTPSHGQVVGIEMHATNGVNPTLAVDGGTAYPIMSSPGVNIPAGTLISGSPYTLMFRQDISAWMTVNFYGQAVITASIVPLGGLIPYTGVTAPNSNFIFPFGQCISTTTYAAYWALMGSPAPAGGCGAGTFQVIDLRGRVPAGLDTLPGSSAASRLTTSSSGCGSAFTFVGASCANGSESETLTVGQLPSITSSNSSQSITVYPAGSSSYDIPISIGAAWSGITVSGGSFFCCIPTTSGSPSGPAVTYTNTFSASNSISVTSSSTSGLAHPIVQPVVGVTYLLRVL